MPGPGRAGALSVAEGMSTYSEQVAGTELEPESLPSAPAGKSGWPWQVSVVPLQRSMLGGGRWPRLSIVIPSFNQAEYLEEALRSVILQGYPNLQLLVIDGGSTDGSVDVVRKYASFIARWRSRRDAGQAAAINEGFAAADGELLAYLNSDDLYQPGALAAVAEAFVAQGRPDTALLCGAVEDFDANGRGRIHGNSQFGSVLQWLDGGVSLHQPGCFWTKYLWHRCGPLLQNSHYVFDRYFFAACRTRGARFLHLPTVLARFRHHHDSKTILSSTGTDRFSEEWEGLKADLEAHLSRCQGLAVALGRRLVSSQRIASAALSARRGAPERHELWRHVLRNPLWLIHRPVFGAARRLLVSDPRSLLPARPDRRQAGGPPVP